MTVHLTDEDKRVFLGQQITYLNATIDRLEEDNKGLRQVAARAWRVDDPDTLLLQLVENQDYAWEEAKRWHDLAEVSIGAAEAEVEDLHKEIKRLQEAGAKFLGMLDVINSGMTVLPFGQETAIYDAAYARFREVFEPFLYAGLEGVVDEQEQSH